MKKWRLFGKAEEPVEIVGITHNEFDCIYNGIRKEYLEAKSRQKSPEAKPNDYMRGLNFALDIMRAHMPHSLTEVCYGTDQ